MTLYVLLMPCPAEPSENSYYENLVEKHCHVYGLDTRLVMAQIQTESNFEVFAVGPDKRGSGASYGLLQIKLSTARILGFKGTLRQLFKPEINIHYGCLYLSQMVYDSGNVFMALDWYNRGPARAKRNPWKKDWLTHPYVSRILHFI